MEKRKLHLIIIGIIISVLIILYFPLYNELGGGDIVSGSPTLQFVTLGKNYLEPLCVLGGGVMDRQVKGWSDGYDYTCIVKSKAICKILFGTYYKGTEEEKKEFFTPEGLFFGPNCTDCCYR